MWIKLSKTAPVRYLNLALLAEVTVEDTPGGPVVRAKAPLRYLTFTGADAQAVVEAMDDVVTRGGREAGADKDVPQVCPGEDVTALAEALGKAGPAADGTPANGEG